MIDLKTFRKIKELKENGVTTKRILEELNISKGMYYKWGLLSEETFIKHLKSRADNGLYNYTSIDSFNKIIENKYFLVNSFVNMNDVNEANRYKNAENMYALCFCNSNSENIPLWYLYAGITGKGIRIGITPKNMLEFCKKIEVYQYNNGKIAEKPIKENQYEIKFGSIYYVRKDGKAIYKNELISIHNIDAKYFIKDYPWNYEKEFRIFIYIRNRIKVEKLAIKFDDKFLKQFRLMYAPESKRKIKNNNFYSIKESELGIKMDLLRRNKEEICKYIKK